METRAIDLMRSLNDAWNRVDRNGVAVLLAPDIEVYPDPSFPAPPARTAAEALVFFEDMREGWGDHHIELLELHDLDAGERCLVKARSNIVGPASGISIPADWSAVVTVRDGRFVRMDYFLDHADALAAARR